MSEKEVKLANSNFNLESLSPKQLEQNLDASMKIGNNVIVIGRRGSGKTQIAKQRIKKAGLKEVYINLSVCERTDLGGYPDMFSASRRERADHFVNVLMPRHFEPLLEGNEPCVALLDEVDKADPSIWAPLLEFTQFKSINGRKFNNLHMSIMTGNLISEGGHKPSEPLLDRAEKYLLQPSVSDFMDWAGGEGGIHTSIRALFADKPDLLYGSSDGGDDYASCSPRGWENTSKTIIAGEQLNWSPDLILNKVAGFVGKQAAIEYDVYYTYHREVVPFVDELMKGNFDKSAFNGFDPIKKLVACMFVCARFATKLDESTSLSGKTTKLPQSSKTVSDFLHYCLDGLEEQVLVSMRNSIRIERIMNFKLFSDPNWSGLVEMISSRVVNI